MFRKDKDWVTDLVLLWLQLAVTCLLRKSFALSRDGSETLSTDILNDRCDQAVWCRNSNRDIGLLIPKAKYKQITFTI